MTTPLKRPQSHGRVWSAWREHWPEYLIESWGLGTFMISACVFATLLENPDFPFRDAIPSAGLRRALMGLAMGLTAVGIIYSPWGHRSGAHLNPALTLSFYRLGKIDRVDAGFYTLFQFIGGAAGVALTALVLPAVAHPNVRYVVTIPGPAGPIVALIAEAAISVVLMLAVLVTSNHPTLSRYTGWFAGFLLLVYITFEAPLSGMSLNPARTVGSAASANVWTSLWIYFAAPIGGMLLAAEAYLRWKGADRVFCAKLNHNGRARCIFHCQFHELAARRE